MLQNIVTVSSVPRYSLGVRYSPDNVTVFYYMHVDAERQARPFYGVFPKMTYSEVHAPAIDYPAGTTTIICVSVAAVAAHAYAGGIAEIQGAYANRGKYRIKDNTGCIAGGLPFTITLYEPLSAPCTVATETIRLYQSIFANVVCMRQRQVDGVATDWRKVSSIGVPQIPIPANYYAWVQTWGPAIVVGDSGTEGQANSERNMVFGDNQDMLKPDYATPNYYQPAGFVLPPTTAGAGNGLYFLQIIP